MKKIKFLLSMAFLAAMFASCTQEKAVDSTQGYLTLNINALVSTNDPSTRAAAPADYDAKTLHVEIQDDKGNIVKSTDNFGTDETFQEPILLPQGNYTVVAHSANWDGSESGFNTPFYYGSAEVTVRAKYLVKANITCTQANVKVTVNYDQSFVQNFKSAITTVLSDKGNFSPLKYVMRETTQSGYIPVGDFKAKLNVVSFSNQNNNLEKAFTNVKARDHYILNFKLSDEGHLGSGNTPGIEVEVDESTNTYTFTFDVPRKSSISLSTLQPNAWSTFATLNAAVTSKTSEFDKSGLTLQWRQSGSEEWTNIASDALNIDDKDNVSVKIKGLTPETAYQYQLIYNFNGTEAKSSPMEFQTEAQTPLYNGGFENWWTSGKVVYPNEQGVTFWDTSNPGSASFGGSNTTSTTEVVRSGSYAAKLESKYIVIKFAAASIYTGKFGALVGTSGAWLNWGAEFTSRPTALKGWMQYAPKAINREGSGLPAGAPGKNEMDQCGMFCALLTESMVIDNTKMDEFPDLETDPRVIAYGALPKEQNVDSKGQWKEVNIPFVYRDLTKKPTHLLIVFSSSKYGDYFHGGEGSTLYLDDFSFEYGDEPETK
ncbi:MAG: PCMD domain-containing protein [Bacteroidaceae bacterium]|nr:PCMD domain-containing protein [Bacteroidaceae bacterium]